MAAKKKPTTGARAPVGKAKPKPKKSADTSPVVSLVQRTRATGRGGRGRR